MDLRHLHDPLPGTYSKGHTTTAADLPLAARLYGCGRFRMGPRYFVEREGLDNALLLLTLRGEGEIEAHCQDGRRRSFPAPPGTAVLLDCRRRHRYATSPRGEGMWDFLWIHFRGDFIQPLVDRVAGTDYALPPQERNRMEHRMLEVLDLAGAISRHADLRIASLLYSLLAQLVEAEARPGTLQMDADGGFPAVEGARDVASEAAAILHLEYTEPLRVMDLAARLHVSGSHLSRLFQQAYGVGPYRYLSTYRVNQAKRLLAYEGRTVEETARLCGFCSSSNFIREFRRIDGQTPLQYRRRIRN